SRADASEALPGDPGRASPPPTVRSTSSYLLGRIPGDGRAGITRHQRQFLLIAAQLTPGAAFVQLPQLLVEFSEVLKVPVDGREADVGDVVAHLEPLHHHLADCVGGD